jgi:DNA-binding NarL/FixJ family response regulator
LNNDEGSVKKQTAYEKFVENTSENLSNSSEMFRLMLDHDFSDLEKQVLYYMVKKYSNKGIARKLNIDESLVKTYVQRIFQRLSVRNRAEAATWARKNLKIAS